LLAIPLTILSLILLK